MRVMQTAIAATGIFLAAAIYHSPVTAQSQCPRCSEDGEQIVACLQKEWGEDVSTIALNDRGSLVRTFSNKVTRTWTVITTMPSGQGCINAHGTHYETLSPAPEGPES